MGLFGNYSKPGPGVSKEEPEKTAFFRFFEIYGRKFGSLVKVNLLYFFSIILFYVPAIIVVLASVKEKGFPFIILKFPIFYLSLLPVALTGPFTAGYTYLIRNFIREKPSFLWSDYIDVAKKNLKQSLLVSLINIVLASVLLFNLQFYYSLMSKNQLAIIPYALCILILALLAFSQYYIYLMLVTFSLNLKQLYRNSIIFSIIGLGRNILITVILAVMIFVHYLFYVIALFFVPFLSISFLAMVINFGAWPILQRYMIDQNPNAQKSEEEEEIIFQDNGKEK